MSFKLTENSKNKNGEEKPIQKWNVCVCVLECMCIHMCMYKTLTNIQYNSP